VNKKRSGLSPNSLVKHSIRSSVNASSAPQGTFVELEIISPATCSCYGLQFSKSFSASIFSIKSSSVYDSGMTFSLHLAWPACRRAFRDCGHRWRHHDCSGAGLFLPYDQHRAQGTSLAALLAPAGALAFWSITSRKCRPQKLACLSLWAFLSEAISAECGQHPA